MQSHLDRLGRCPLSGACNRSRRRRRGRLRYRIMCRRLLAVNLCGTFAALLLVWDSWHCRTTTNGSHRMRGVRVHRTALRCTRVHGFRAAAIFYPNFYPKRQHSGIEMSYLLITAANRSGQPEFVTSLPSWSCGFDSRRPLSTSLVSESVSRYGAGLRRQSELRGSAAASQCPCFPSEASSSPPTGLAGMLMQPWNPWDDQAQEFLT